MGTVLLLAAFLLTVSANPIANSLEGSNEDGPDTHHEDGPPTDDDSELSHQQSTNNDQGEQETSSDDLTHSTDDNEADDTEEQDTQDTSHDKSADYTEDNTASNAGDEHSSSVSNDSTTSTKGGNTTNPTEVTATSSVTTVSTSSTGPDTSTQQSSDMVTTPADADPSDCRNATEKNHTFMLCSYSCQQDEMFVAPDNTTCYLHPPDMMTNFRLTEEYNHTEGNANETGVCYDGRCVRRPTEIPGAPTESSPDTSTQQSNETYTTPSDADPKDCRNATEENHIYVLCTYTCQQDEMFTAPNNSVCYLHPPLVLTDILFNQEDNRTEHSTNETGVCVDGRCVRRTTETPTAPTQSLPTTTTTTTTTAETDFKTTENPVSEQTSFKSGEPNDVSGSLPVYSQTQNTHTENIGNPKNQENEHLPQEEKPSSTATDGPALPAIRD